MASREEDELAPSNTEGFKVGEKKTVEEYQKLGKDRRQTGLDSFFWTLYHALQFYTHV